MNTQETPVRNPEAATLPEQEIRLIMQSQLDRQSRLDAADDVLRNNADLGRLAGEVDDLHRQYLEIARQMSRDYIDN